MPRSDGRNKGYAAELIGRLRPRTILDVGPGVGTYGRMVRELFEVEQLDAVEIWAPYIEQYQLREIYDSVLVCDIRFWQTLSYDLVILGDVLEHLSFDDALKLWRRLSEQAGAVLLSIPIVHYPQGIHEDNPFETHLVEDWSTSMILEHLGGIREYREFGDTGAFLAVFRGVSTIEPSAGIIPEPKVGAGGRPPDLSPLTAAQTGNSAATFLQRDIPIFIPAFENPTYVRNMVNQLRAKQLNNIIVLDNASTSSDMTTFLDSDFGATVIRLESNPGPRHIFMDDDSYFLLPELFCVTDPDLELNPDLPDDFLAKLVSLTERFRVGKAGFSIDISDPSALRQEEFDIGGRWFKIWDWEQQYWTNPVGELDGLGTIYKATIDTTFAVYNKKYFRRETDMDAVRVAGVFTCLHLPWYPETGLPSAEEHMYRSTERFSYYMKQTPSKPEH